MFREDIILDIKESTSIILDLLRSQDLLREGLTFIHDYTTRLHLKIEHWYLSYPIRRNFSWKSVSDFSVYQENQRF